MDGFISVVLIDTLLLILLLKPLKAMLYRFIKRISRIIYKKHMNFSRPSTAGDEKGHVMNPLSENEYSADKSSLSQFVASVKRCVGSNDVGMSVGFKDVSYTLKSGKTIVAPQSGHIEKGTMWAVMGASGAGKSELLF